MEQTNLDPTKLRLQPQNIQSVRNGYEGTLVLGLLDIVRPGDFVVIVGSGLGITAAVAAACGGKVECYEASKEFLKLSEKTISFLGLNVIFHHNVVGTYNAEFKAKDLGEIIAPTDLPHCDVLQMDCEGAELEIIKNMTIKPREILVETHGLYGSRTSEVELLLKHKGYRVTDLGLAEERFAQACEQFDIRVLRGERDVPTGDSRLHNRCRTDLVGDNVCSGEPTTS